MYASATEIIEAGQAGKWIKVTPEERDRIVKSIATHNTLKNSTLPVNSGQGGINLRHYERDGYLVVQEGPADVEDHPDDTAERKARDEEHARKVLGI